MTKIFRPFSSLFLAVVLGSGGKAVALTSGPAMPEYTQFEELNMTDMVNLATGDFTWSTPIMTVPGPALGFPLVLSYHANPGVKEEASWIGLGWNLQAGAITRQVNNLPDDFKDAIINETIKSNTIHAWSASIALNGVSIGYSYHSLRGHGGTVGYDLLDFATEGLVSAEMTYGWGSQKGSTGVSLGVQSSTAKLLPTSSIQGAASLSVGIDASGSYASGSLSMLGAGQESQGKLTSFSLSRVGGTLSQSGGLAGGISMVGASYNSSGVGDLRTSKAGIVIPIPTKVGLLTLGFSAMTSRISGIKNDHHYGFLHGDAPGMECVNDADGSIDCMDGQSGQFQRRHEYLAADREFTNGTRTKLMRTSEDSYIVHAQGISGAFMPHRQEDGDYANTLRGTSKVPCTFYVFCDPWDRDTKNRTWELDRNRNKLNSRNTSDVYWRFADDLGGAEYTIPTTTRDEGPFASYQSKKIEAKYTTSGKLKGFDIRNASGILYSFDFPLMNVWEGKYGLENGDLNLVTSQSYESSYAYAWLLTSIKSLDYVDLGETGLDGEDLGGWVKMTYGDGNQNENLRPVQYWATPYRDPTAPGYPGTKEVYSGPNPRTNTTSITDENIKLANSRSNAWGLKEIAYLHSVETPTHKAIFTTTNRDDNHPFNQAHAFDIYNNPEDWDGSIVFHAASGTFGGTARVNPQAFLSSGISALSLPSGHGVEVVLHFTYTQTLGSNHTPGACGPFTAQFSDSLIFSNSVVGTLKSLVSSSVDPLGCLDATTTSHPTAINIFKVTVKSPIGTQNQSKRLTAINLYENAAVKDAGGTINGVPPVATARFNQDYSLCGWTPNSLAQPNHGKLTLNQLILGSDGTVASELQPYKFYYGSNFGYQTPTQNTWVPWEVGQWDRWGNRCMNCSDAFHEPDVHTGGGERVAAAWNLKRIVSPSGSEVSVTYAPREYSYVGPEPIAENLGNGTYKVLIGSGGPEMWQENHIVSDATGLRRPWWHYHVKLGNLREKFIARGWTIQSYRFEMMSNHRWGKVSLAAIPSDCAPEEFPSGNVTFHGWLHIDGMLGCPGDTRLVGCADIRDGDEDLVNRSFKGANIDISAEITGPNPGAFVAGFHSSYSLINGDDEYVQVNQDSTSGDFRLYAIISVSGNTNPSNEYANGAVVKDLRFREPFSNTIQEISYSYEDGVTPSLPATYSDYGDARDKQGRGLEYYAGSPGVTYSKVTTKTNRKWESRYYFLTAKNLPTRFGPVQDANSNTSIFVSTTVVDMSSLWGALWKKEDIGGDGNPIKSTLNTWGVNLDQIPGGINVTSDLPSTGLVEGYPKANGVNYLRSQAGDENKKPFFGLHQTLAAHRYFNKKGCYVDMDCQDNIITSRVILKRMLPASIRMENEQEGLKTISHSYFHDFKSGVPLKSRTINSDNAVTVVEKIPAYYRYEGMDAWKTPDTKDMNALTQEYATTTYRYPQGTRSDFLQNESSSRAISSNVQIWRPYDINADMRTSIGRMDLVTYRQYQSYVWRDNPGAPTASHWIPDDYCHTNDNYSVFVCSDAMATAGNRWLLTERVNRYDGFSHATDVMDAKGVNQTSLYGQDLSLVTAFLQNTPTPSTHTANTLQAFHESFEGYGGFKDRLNAASTSEKYALNPTLSKSGKSSLEVKNIPGSGSMVCFDLGALAPGREYEASAWYQDATGGGVSDGINGTRAGIFLGENAACASEYHPNGYDGTGVVSGGGGGSGDPATGSRAWKRISTTIRAGQCPVGSEVDNAILCLYATKVGSGKGVRYDEIRVKPGGSKMSTYTYDRGLITSSVDSREVTVSYEYDPQGNLSRIRNDDGVIVSEQAKKMGRR